MFSATIMEDGPIRGRGSNAASFGVQVQEYVTCLSIERGGSALSVILDNKELAQVISFLKHTIPQRCTADLQAAGKYVRHLREERGWTQEEFAEQIGLSGKTVYNIEQGKHATHHWDKVFEALDITMDDFMREVIND